MFFNSFEHWPPLNWPLWSFRRSNPNARFQSSIDISDPSNSNNFTPTLYSLLKFPECRWSSIGWRTSKILVSSGRFTRRISQMILFLFYLYRFIHLHPPNPAPCGLPYLRLTAGSMPRPPCCAYHHQRMLGLNGSFRKQTCIAKPFPLWLPMAAVPCLNCRLPGQS